jgi:hypothetical protein
LGEQTCRTQSYYMYYITVCLLLEDGQRRRMSLDPAYPWLLSGMTPEEMKHVPIIASIYIESVRV